MKVFLSLCLLFSLVSPAVLQTCRKCKNFNGTECTENEESPECPFSLFACKSAIISGNLLRPFIPESYYDCDICEAGNYAFTPVADRFFNLDVRCCKGNKCNAKPLEIPSEPMKPNGRECTGCFAEGQKECKGVELLRCSGNQTKCIKMHVVVIEYYAFGTRDKYRFSARGCATPDMCKEKGIKYNLFRTHVDFQFECSNAL